MRSSSTTIRALDARWWLIFAVVFQTHVATGDALETAYAEVLKGDYVKGRQTIQKLIEVGQKTPEIERFDEWLGEFEKTQTARTELQRKTYDWNVAQAKEAIQKGRVYLALSFASQATAYADNPKAICALDWVPELMRKAKEEAEALRDKSEWSKVSAYYFHMTRICPDDKALEQARKDSDRHARLEFVYKDKKAVKERTAGVSEALVEGALTLVDRSYYTEPDFKVMAEGALRNLLVMCEAPKLKEVFDGLADPNLKKYFEDEIHALLRKIEKSERVSVNQLRRLYNEVAKINEKSIELPKGVLVIEFLEGAIGKLDQFTSMVWPADEREFNKQVMGNFFGVGIQLGADEFTNRLKVATPLENSPALEAGIQPGDLILAVDGEDTKGWTSDEAVRKITGEAGTTVTLTIFRPSVGERIDFPLKRRQIILTTVRGVNRKSESDASWNYLLDPEQGVAYVRLTGFNPDSKPELERALRSAKDQGMKGLILDLRFNPGGLLETAVDTVSLFLKSGQVVRTSGRRDKPQIEEVRGDAAFADLPIVVLVNDASASASEILSGALQDHKRAIVLGERTFGKGSVQKVLELGREARLRLTTATYFLPSGRTPHKSSEDAETWGVDPDLKIELTPKEVRAVLDRGYKSEIIRNSTDATTQKADADEEERKKKLAEFKADEKNPGKTDEEKSEPLLSDEDIKLLTSDPNKADDTDAQLQMALLVMRAKLASNLNWPKLAANASKEPTAVP